jgi:hypothetical protein
MVRNCSSASGVLAVPQWHAVRTKSQILPGAGMSRFGGTKLSAANVSASALLLPLLLPQLWGCPIVELRETFPCRGVTSLLSDRVCLVAIGRDIGRDIADADADAASECGFVDAVLMKHQQSDNGRTTKDIKSTTHRERRAVVTL